jgi:general secretion pathway protein D
MNLKKIFLILLLLLPASPVRADLPMPDQNITLNFQNTDIELVLKFFSDLTGTVFIKSDLVRGFITLVAPQKVSPAEGLNILQAVLELKGFVIVPGPGKMMRVLSQAEALQVDLDVQVGRGSNALVSGDRMLTQVVPLKFSSAPELKQQLAPLSENRDRRIWHYSTTRGHLCTVCVSFVIFQYFYRGYRT